MRLSVLAVLVAGPLAFGAVHEPVFVPILGALYLAGAVSWAHGHWARSHGHEVPRIPGRLPLAAFHALVLFQLAPLPPGLLALVSPGSAAFHAARGDPAAWSPITVSPELTLRGLAFLVGMTLLYATVIREFRDPVWRHRLVYAVIGTGLLITLVALVQLRSAEPTRIYGYWKPGHAWAVFGPYVNRNHFAGFLVMAIPLAVGMTIRAVHDLGRAWGRRRRGWLALFDPEGLAVLRRGMVAMFLVVGLLLSGSRAGLAGLVVGFLTLLILGPRGYRVTGVTAAVLALALVWADFSGMIRGFETRGIQASRIDPWLDQARLIPEFPLFGVGFNALGPAYRPIQTNRSLGSRDQAHNEYLQVLLDTGVAGVAILLPLFLRMLLAAVGTARAGGQAAGLCAAVFASAADNLFDFNWQIPANAAAFFALAGLVMAQRASLTLTDGET